MIVFFLLLNCSWYTSVTKSKLMSIVIITILSLQDLRWLTSLYTLYVVLIISQNSSHSIWFTVVVVHIIQYSQYNTSVSMYPLYFYCRATIILKVHMIRVTTSKTTKSQRSYSIWKVKPMWWIMFCDVWEKYSLWLNSDFKFLPWRFVKFMLQLYI